MMTDTTAVDRQLALVHALYRRTLARKIDWRVGPHSAGFDADLGEYSLRIRLVPDNDYPDEPDFWLEIRDLVTGRLIDTISNVTLRPVMDKVTNDGLSPFAVLEQTYDLARRQALNVDDALERILATLNGP